MPFMSFGGYDTAIRSALGFCDNKWVSNRFSLQSLLAGYQLLKVRNFKYFSDKCQLICGRVMKKCFVSIDPI